MGQHIIFDFDGTITEDDTIGNIAQAALQWRKTPAGGGEDLTKDWQHIVESYAQDLAEYDQTQPPADQRTTWQQERDYLRGRRVVEEASLARVRASGLFVGFAAAAAADDDDDSSNHLLFEAGRRDRDTGRIRIRGGFGEYMTLATARKDVVHVVSVNWSAAYIRGVLEPWGITSIVANEIQVDGSITAPLGFHSQNRGKNDLPKALTTSSDKLEATQHLLNSVGGQCIGYFGDSTTDIECLHSYGGCVLTTDGQNTLVKTLRRLDCDVPWISQSQIPGADVHICWAHNFTEIAARADAL